MDAEFHIMSFTKIQKKKERNAMANQTVKKTMKEEEMVEEVEKMKGNGRLKEDGFRRKTDEVEAKTVESGKAKVAAEESKANQVAGFCQMNGF